MAIDFPNSPIEGQSFTAAGLSWIYTGGKWLSATETETTVAGANAGDIKFTAASVPPTDWAMCDGTILVNGQTTYPDLWAVIPAAMKSGANIVLPDLRGRAIIGTGTGAGLTARALLATGGVETVTLTAAQSGLRSHQHTNPTHYHANQVGWGTGTESYPVWDGTSNKAVYGLATTTGGAAVSTHAVTQADAASSHDNMQPWIALNPIICLKNGAGAAVSGGASVTISDTPPVGASQGNLWYESDTGRLYIYYDSYWVEVGHPTTAPAAPGGAPRNRVINGGFDVWQRGGSGFGANGTYAADQWVTLSTGSTQATTRQAFTPGNAIPGYEPTNFLRTVVTSVAGASNYALMVQRIESARTLAGQQVTVSFWAKADASKNMSIEFAQQFGTGGSPSGSVTAIGATKLALTTAWQRFTVPVNIPSVAGKTFGTTHDGSLQLHFWFDAGSSNDARTASLGQQSGTFDIWGVQVEAGAIANPFEVRTYDDVLQACYRYFQVYEQHVLVGQTGTDGRVYRAGFNFHTKFRATPTFVGGTGSITFDDGSVAAAVAAGSPTVSYMGRDSAQFHWNASAWNIQRNLVSRNDVAVYSQSFSAEL